MNETAKAAEPSWAWKRPVWMRLSATSALVAVTLIVTSADGAATLSLRQTGQIQFMHAMASFACATFMNIGAIGAGRAPAFFLSGTAIFCFPVYLAHFLGWPLSSVVHSFGAIILAIGWCVLIASARGIDRADRQEECPSLSGSQPTRSRIASCATRYSAGPDTRAPLFGSSKHILPPAVDRQRPKHLERKRSRFWPTPEHQAAPTV